MAEIPVLLIVLPLLASFPCFLEIIFPRFRTSPVWSLLAVGGCIVLLGVLYGQAGSGGVLITRAGGWEERIGIALYFDGAAWLSSLVVLSVCFAALLYSVSAHISDPVFYAFFLVMVSGMEGVVLTGDLFNMFVFLEILAIAAYVLIAFSGKGHAVAASFRYLLVSSLGMLVFLLGILILYRYTGTLSIRLMAERMGRSPIPAFPRAAAFAALTAGIGVRTAFMPFHPWLPEAHAWAPHPVSAVLSGVMVKVSFVALWRIFTVFEQPIFRMVFLWLGAGTALFAVVGALSQTDCKKLLAYHSVSQMGFILAAFGAGTMLSGAAAFAHMTTHALFKSLLFLSVGVTIDAAGERSVKLLHGAGRRLPFVYAAFLAGALSIAGIPPFNGFVSKSLVSASLKDAPAAYALLWFAGAGTAASFFKLSGIFRGKRRTPAGLPPMEPAAPSESRPEDQPGGDASVHRGEKPYGKVPVSVYLPLGLLAVLCLLTGLFPSFWTGMVWRFLYGLALPAVPSPYAWSGIGSSLLTAVCGFLLYRAVKSGPGDAVSSRLRSLAPGMSASLLLLAAGFAGLSIVMWILT